MAARKTDRIAARKQLKLCQPVPVLGGGLIYCPTPTGSLNCGEIEGEDLFLKSWVIFVTAGALIKSCCVYLQKKPVKANCRRGKVCTKRCDLHTLECLCKSSLFLC